MTTTEMKLVSDPSPARPRILFLARSLEMGGAERQLTELAVGLHSIGWQVTVVTLYGRGPFEARLREAGIERVDLGKRGRWDLLPSMWRLLRVLRRRKPHIVHGYLEVPNILLTSLRPFNAKARLVWGLRASDMTAHDYGLVARLETRFAARLSRWANLIICNSNAGRAYYEAAGFATARMTVIPNGVDVERFRPDPQARESLRAEWGMGSAEKIIGLVGRLDPMKDHHNFLGAAAIVAAARADVRFVCVGDGPDGYRAKLQLAAAEANLASRVMWLRARPDVWRVYNALDVAVSSSRFGEGFPNTVAEAMATGVACVVTDVGDSAAIVGDRGWVCPPGDSHALARAMLAALDSLPVDASAVRQRIAANFTPAELVRRSAEALSALLDADHAADATWLQRRSSRGHR